VLHAQPSVRSIYILFDGKRNPREHQTTMMSDPSGEYWRQLDERGRQQIGHHHQRPGAGDRIGPAAPQRQAPVESVESRVFSGGAQRLGIGVEGKRSGYAAFARTSSDSFIST
jgi:hypothetical protein